MMKTDVKVNDEKKKNRCGNNFLGGW